MFEFQFRRRSAAVLMAVCLLVFGTIPAPADEAVVYRAGGLMLTEAELQQIVEDTGAAARGGTAHVVECTGAFGYSTIQSAIDASSDGDVIVILPNDCTADARWHEAIDFHGKDLRLQSANPDSPDVVSATIIDAENANRGVQSTPSGMGRIELDGIHFERGAETVFLSRINVTISNCVFRNAGARAVYVRGNSFENISPLVRIVDCDVSLNHGRTEIIRSDTVDLVIERCNFSSNTGRRIIGTARGSIKLLDSVFRDNGVDGWTSETCYFLEPAYGLVDACLFLGNRGREVGAIFVEFDNSETGHFGISNCAFVNNVAIGSLRCYACIRITNEPIEIAACTFAGNRGDDAGAVFAYRPGTIIRRTVFCQNRAIDVPTAGQFTSNIENVSYCRLQELAGFEDRNNIDADPFFVDPGHWDDNGTPADLTDDTFIPGDYRLLPGSPCIDAGDPAYIPTEGETDLDGHPRLRGCRVDMGAYEAPRGDPGSGDFDGNGAVDLEDVPTFVDALLHETGGACVADLNASGTADGADVQLFTEAVLF